MRSLSRTFRILAFGFALAQYALAGVLTVLDARSEAESYRDVASHIESSSVPCDISHHGADCAVCHFLGIRIGGAAKPCVIPNNWVTTLVSQAVEPEQAPASTPHRRIFARGPPSVIA